MATDTPKPMSPTAAVARHLEWLEVALAAARDEEVRRQGRLDRATDKNRDKRSVRLAEVTAEVGELAALVKGLKDLQGKNPASARKGRATTRTSAGPIRRQTPASAAPGAAASTSASKAASPASTKPAAKGGARRSKPASTRTAKTGGETAASPAARSAATAPTGPTV
jgi:hypothetical protein